MKQNVKIILPQTIYIKKEKENQENIFMQEEYNIYFENIIQPYHINWDIQVRCAYGANLGHCWRLSKLSKNVSEFPLEIVIYDEYGEMLASKRIKIVMVDRKERQRTSVLFIGDSLTHAQVYVNHVVNQLYGIDTVGSRCFDGHTRIEGRGGWSYGAYLNYWYEEFGMSPFLFPKQIEAQDYYGDRNFIQKTREDGSEVYQYYGYQYDEIKDGQYFTADHKLYRRMLDTDELISEEPEFEFDFSKYIKRFQMKKPDIVSILLGTNDLHRCSYEMSDVKVKKYLDYAKQFVSGIHRCDPGIRVIFNLPILGGDQYSWGMWIGCYGGAKVFRHNILNACEELIHLFDNRQSENIYLAPMVACVDPVNGFPHAYVKANKYSDAMEKKGSNWGHPNDSGYYQMGDALAGVIEYIR